LALLALTDAADEDRGTGGIDIQRGIFPTVLHCSEPGIEQSAESEIRAVYDTILAGRSASHGAGATS
jgi:proteasome beta subunit